MVLIDEIYKLSKKDQKVLLNVMETGILSDVKAKRSKSARQTHMHLSVYATSDDTSNILTPLLSRFIKLNVPEYNLEIFTEICQKLLSRRCMLNITSESFDSFRIYGSSCQTSVTNVLLIPNRSNILS